MAHTFFIAEGSNLLALKCIQWTLDIVNSDPEVPRKEIKSNVENS